MSTKGRALLQRVAIAADSPFRLRLLGLLAERAYSVQELTGALGHPPSAVSTQLGILRRVQLVHYRAESPRRFYRLATEETAGQAVWALVAVLVRAQAQGPRP
jgi:DNA-binding transcriptional ArsR family regulator